MYTWLCLRITSSSFISSIYLAFWLVRASTCFMGVEDQNLALVHSNTCLMGEEQDDNVKTVVRASTCSMGEENAKIQKIKYLILLYGNRSEVISRHSHVYYCWR